MTQTSTNTSTKTRCTFVLPDGERCRCWALRGGVHCLNHDASATVRALRRQAAQLGGKARGRQLARCRLPASAEDVPAVAEWALETHDDVAGALAECFRRLLQGQTQLSARDANAAVALAGALSSEIDKAKADASTTAVDVTPGRRGR